MIVHIEPVADVAAIAVDGQRLAIQGVEDHVGNELFRELVRAVVIGAIAGDYGQSIGMVPGSDQVVGRGLAGGIG